MLIYLKENEEENDILTPEMRLGTVQKELKFSWQTLCYVFKKREAS